MPVWRGGGGPLMKADNDEPNGAGASANHPVPTEPAGDDPQALFFDPYAVIQQLGFKDRPSQITYGTLFQMVWKSPVIHAVINTRVRQVSSFAKPEHDRYKLGFRIKLRDAEREPTKQDRIWMRDMESVIMTTGVTKNARGRTGFGSFLQQIVWDSLVYDQMCFEVVPNRKGQPAEWYAVDGSTMRLADTAKGYLDEDDTKEARYVQVYDGMVIAEFTQDQLCFGIRNPRTSIQNCGYGNSELEMLIQAITALLFGWNYNKSFFTQGSAAKGLLNLKGTMPQKQLKAFRRQWAMMVQGASNQWRTPILNAEDVQWVNMQSNNRDMEFSSWIDFLIKVCCSMYSMDPIEVNFQYGNSGQTSSLQEASNREKITESKERGLRPLLEHISAAVNKYILWPLNENFEFCFVGLDAMTRDQVADLNQKRVKTTHTVDELRAEDDKPPLPDGLGEIILDPTFLQWAQIKMGQAEGADGEDGMPGAPGDEEEPGGEQDDDEDDDFESLLAQYDKKDEPKQEEPNKPPVNKSMVVLEIEG
jgi:hypothetical protein